jgi:hypothetical protein
MAARYWVGGSATWNATAGTKWATTSGGAGGAAVPTSADDVFFDAASGAVTITLGVTGTAKTFTCTGFTGTFAMSTFQLTMSGDVTLVNTMTLSGTNTTGFSMGTSCNVTTGGLTIPVVFTFGTGLTFTLLDNFNTTSNIRYGNTTFNGSQINLLTNANFLSVVNNTTCSGTTIINITGGNVTIGANSTSINSGIALDIIINSSGTVTFRQDSNVGGGAFGIGGTKTMQYLGGTLIFSCAYFRIVSGGTYTFDMAGQSIPALTMAVASSNLSFTSLLNIIGTFSLVNDNITISGAAGFDCGTLSLTAVLAGTRTLTLTSGNTYNIGEFIVTGSSNSFRFVVASSTPGVQAILTLSPAGTQNVMYTNATDIDSSAGQTIWSFQQVVSNTLNWGNLNVSNIGGGGTFTFVN